MAKAQERVVEAVLDIIVSIVVLITSAWMAIDAKDLGYRKEDIQGLAAIGPTAWFICGLLLWIVAFPLYIVKRPELRAAGEARRLAAAR